MFELKNVSKRYPNGFPALDNVNLVIYEKKINALMGKSTPGQMAATIYKKVNKSLWLLAQENIKAHLKKLEQEGMLINKQ